MNYDDMLQIILDERKNKKLSIEKLANYGQCTYRSMSSYIYRERMMPLCIMLDTLQNLGYKITITNEQTKQVVEANKKSHKKFIRWINKYNLKGVTRWTK